MKMKSRRRIEYPEREKEREREDRRLVTSESVIVLRV